MNTNSNHYQSIDPGTGTKYHQKTGRFIRPDGQFNVIKSGHSWASSSVYQYLINVSWLQFMLIIVVFFLLLNAFFALLYLTAGISHLTSQVNDNSISSQFAEAFFFSVQTFTTVGYGSLAPTGILMNMIATVEMLTGLLSFALATGLVYGKFSRPRARMLFSKKALIAPYHDGTSFQFRIANKRRSQLIKLNAKVILSWEEVDGAIFTRKYHTLELEQEDILFFPLSWTIVHPISKDSPITGWANEEYISHNAEFLILVSGYDDTYHQMVHQKYSYTYKEIEWNATFDRAFSVNNDKQIVFDLNQIHSYSKP
jgi:inward rectifier potassium channel